MKRIHHLTDGNVGARNLSIDIGGADILYLSEVSISVRINSVREFIELCRLLQKCEIFGKSRFIRNLLDLPFINQNYEQKSDFHFHRKMRLCFLIHFLTVLKNMIIIKR